MKRFLSKSLIWVSALALSLLPLAASAQQNGKPVVVVSINNLNDLFGDIAAMTELAGQADFGRIAVGMGGIYTGGIDKTKPGGLIVSFEGMESKILGFVPVTNLKQLLGTYRERIGTPRDVGDGVLEVAADRAQPIFVKEQGGWAFVAQYQRHLQTLPKDPVALLGGLEKQYDVAVQVNLANMPAELRDLAVSQIKMGYQSVMAAQAQNQSPEERRQAEAISQAMLQNMVTFVEETEQMTIGFSVDGKTKRTVFEFGMTARPNTTLAKSMSGYGKTPSDFHGFVLPNSAVTFIGATPLAPSDIEQMQQLLQVARQTAMKGIDDDASLPNPQARDAAKEVVGTMLDVLKATVQRGKMDVAGSLQLASKSLTFVSGLGLAEGDKVETALKKLVTLIPPGADTPDIRFNVGSIKGVNLHRVAVPLGQAERQIREVFGEKLEILVGTAKNGLYLALGKDGEATLRNALDVSERSKSQPAPAAEFQVALSPILKFAASVDNNPQLSTAAATSEKYAGKDHVIVNTRPVDRGFIYRLEIEEGIVQFAGEAVRAAQGGQGR